MGRAMSRRTARVMLCGLCTFIIIMSLSHHFMNHSLKYKGLQVLHTCDLGSSKDESTNCSDGRKTVREEAWYASEMEGIIPWITRGMVENMMSDYEIDRQGCSVKYDKDGPSKERRNTPPCSREVFREFIATRNSFPWEGALWGSKTNPNYQPAFCTLDEIGDFKDLGRTCTHGEKNSFKIVVYGDSNANQLKNGILKTLKSLKATCFQDRGEVFGDSQERTRDVNYFATHDIPAEYLQGTRSIYRGNGDRAREYKCIYVSSSKGWNITVEYISATRLVDTSISMRKELNRSLVFSSFNEYLFRHYYKDKGYPDALFIWVPFHHMKWFASLRKLALDVSYLDQLARIYLPTTTQIYWIPDSRECHNPEWILPNGMGTNQMLYVMNRVLYETLRPRLLNTSSSVYPFLDLGRIVCDVTYVWHQDGGHMTNEFYAVLSRILLQIACS